jgi:hypothetical protein
MWSKKMILSLFCWFFSLWVFTQDTQEVKVKDMPFRQRLFFGGDFGLRFGSTTYINLAPVVGYRINNRLSAGLGPIYIFEKYKYYDIKTSTYGGKGIISFAVVKNVDQYINIGVGDILLHVENEVLNVQKSEYVYDKIIMLDERLWIDNVLAGFGLNFPFGERSGINMYALWDITQHEFSPYSNPVIRLSFYF